MRLSARNGYFQQYKFNFCLAYLNYLLGKKKNNTVKRQSETSLRQRNVVFLWDIIIYYNIYTTGYTFIIQRGSRVSRLFDNNL